ncbi:MAG: NAD(P)H-dependent oxidoreductase [Acidobacteriota bacterium]|nr:NAD(P)H-dependent oxidoreductase [Acidobacteriota bacterium]MDH3529594.1 NAD(P)H-dependent oxidoreductase [Acidobacteriota bacterium]
MRRILILFAHPRLENSRINRQLLVRIPAAENVTFHDLYENYPDFDIDVEHEKELLLRHDVIIWQHPFYWYSSPPILKQWIDMVLEYGWAYGTGGNRLKGKSIFNAITTGGDAQAYCPEGYNCFTVTDFMRPFEQTARLCLMDYLPPFAVMGTHRMSADQILEAATEYGKLIESIGNGEFDIEKARGATYLNEVNGEVGKRGKGKDDGGF